MTAYQGGEVLAEVVRSGFVEGLHRGSVVVLGADGSVVASAGDITGAIFPRSSNKPMQAVGMLRAGLRFEDSADLALGSASHYGEPVHVDRARAILAAGGLDESDLACPPDLPVLASARRDVLAAGGGPARLFMNCSGKHSAMLRTCQAAGWPTEGYREAGHPLQKTIQATVEDLIGGPVPAAGVDGCGAPVFALSLTQLAKVFLNLVHAEPGTPERLVADAMREHPLLVAGTGGDDTLLMQGIPGLLSKGGAEGVAAVAIPGVGAIAAKIDDGASRARTPVTVAALRKLNVSAGVLDDLAEQVLLGGGHPVGAVRAVW
ncbi:asparaginase [Longispora albida]|uniref:asparaginase n=1 Tax=Longispora albida TaxID=203523 RepID=UPI00037590B2|nr:asparaginase [Longispora albida]